MLTTDYLSTLSGDELQKVILRERIKCATDYKYLIETYFTVDAGGKRQPFVLFPHQIKSLKAYIEYTNNITMKTRQMGYTTFTSAYVACELVNNSNYKALVISKEMKSSKAFLKNIKDILDEARNLTRISYAAKSPSWLIPEYKADYNNKESFHLENGSYVDAQGNTEDAGRGYSGLNLAIVDEVAFIDRKSPDRMNSIWAALGPALSTVKGKAIMISCVTKDTFVFTDKGIQQIEDFIQDDDGTVKGYEIPEYKILGHNGFRKGNLFKNNGFGKTYKLKTKYTELEAHENHNIYAYTDGKFQKTQVKNLKAGDFLNVKKGMNIWGNNDDVSDFKASFITRGLANKFEPKIITPDLGYFLGLYISEGNMSVKNGGGWVDITCGDSEITTILDKIGLRWTTRDSLHYRICSRNLIEFMQYIGFKQEKANKKEIPKRLMQCSRDVLVAILQGIFDGDGGVDIKNGKSRIIIGVTSGKLISQIRILLGNLGILSYRYLRPKENNKPHPDKNGNIIKANFDTQVLELSAWYSQMFMDKVGFRLARKKKLVGKRIDYRDSQPLPNGDDIIDELYKCGFSGQGLRKLHGIRIDNSIITLDKAKKIISLLSEAYRDKAKSEWLFEDDSVWVPIENIEESEDYTYDVSLPDIDGDKWCHSVTHSLLNSYNTPFGSNGWYYETYTNAKKMGFNIIDAHWTEHPMFSQGQYQWIKDDEHPDGGYIKFYEKEWPSQLFDRESGTYVDVSRETYNFIKDGKVRSPWYDFESNKLGPRKTACELDCSFIGTGGEVLDADMLRRLKIYAETVEYYKPYDAINNAGVGFLNLYKEFHPYEEGHKYVIGGDSMTGDGSDYSTAVVLNMNTLKICGTIKLQCLPRTFGDILFELGKRFGGCHVVVENQGGGATALQRMKELNYHNIYYSTLNKKDETLGISKRKIGLWSSNDTRIKGGDKLEEYIRLNTIIVNCMDLVDELYNWIWDKDGKRRHAPGKHDDLIMALQWAVYYHYYVFRRRNRNREIFTQTFSRQINGVEDDRMFKQDIEYKLYQAKRNNGRDIIDEKKNFIKKDDDDKRRGTIIIR